MDENKTKINFFKKIWYSITNFKKYSELKEEAAKKSLEYLAILTAIIAMVIAIFPTYKSYKFITDGVNYIQNEANKYRK